MRRTTAFLLATAVAGMFSCDDPPSGAGLSSGPLPIYALFTLGPARLAPFPSDWFTVADPTQITGRRVNLPLPDRLVRPSDYEDTVLINTLDGFNLQPRLSIPFSDRIDVTTVKSDTMFLIRLGDMLVPMDPAGRVVGINQIVWDPSTNTLHVESDEFLDQHTRYALIVTRGVKDAAGNPVGASDAFRRFRGGVQGEYGVALLEAIDAAQRLGVGEEQIAVASVFTTMSSMAVMEKIRDQIKAGTPSPAYFNLGPGGERTVFELGQVTSVTLRQQNRVNPPDFAAPVMINLSAFGMVPGVVGHLAYGKYLSPQYRTSERFIPDVGTRTGTPAAQGTEEIYFTLFLPAGPKPAGGWPVALYGTGSATNKDQHVFHVAKLAQHGIASMIINAVGRGLGPLGTLNVEHFGGSVTFPSGGRSSDVDGDGTIGTGGSAEGQFAAAPRTLLNNRDAVRQTTIDYMQLVRVIQTGMDVDGDTETEDLDPSRISFYGFSFGATYGMLFLALDPDLRAAAFAGQGAGIDQWRLTNRAQLAGSLESRTPPLLNSPGITHLDGLERTATRFFNENMPLRNGVPMTARLADGTDRVIQSPVINDVSGAMEIQDYLESREWVWQSAHPSAYARHLRRKPLAGASAKPVLRARQETSDAFRTACSGEWCSSSRRGIDRAGC